MQLTYIWVVTGLDRELTTMAEDILWPLSLIPCECWNRLLKYTMTIFSSNSL
jgi:hypothetical protein